jgi:class 3 adenylate cyclase/tetratricopeptide (TPR) repeat protein
VTVDPAMSAVPSGERKLVTLVFADLSGFTALASSLDPEEVYAVVRPGLAAMQRLVEEHGGTVPQVMGDGFMAVFGVPTAHEDDAERAVRAALAVRDHARALHRAGGWGTGIRFPEAHAGVNSGEVMVAPSSELSGFAILGDTVNVAARLADLARPGVVLVAEPTVRRTGHAIRFGPARAYRAKGKPRPVTAFEAIEVRSALPAGRATPIVSGSFVNRELELDALEQALGQALLERHSNVLVVTAEPGAGKTRLATEFTSRRPGTIVLTGRCTPYGQRLPLSPLGGAVQALIGLPADAPATVADREVRRLADRVAGSRRAGDLVRGLKLLLGTIDPGEVRDPSGAAGESTLAARAVVEGLAREGPVVTVVDDLHWADAQLLELLRTTSTDPWSGPVLLLGLSRPEALEANDALPTLELGALPEPQLRELGELALGPGAPGQVLERIAARASGNPLFLEESLSMLVESGALVRQDGTWIVADPELLDRVPATIRTLIAARLDGLPPDERRVLRDAAVCGEAAWDRLLETLSGGADVREALKRLVQRGLLQQRSYSPVPGAEEYGFRHVLIREVAYASIPRRDRSGLHLQVATWLRESSRLPEEPLAELAHHYELAWRLSYSSAAGTADPALARLAAEYLGRWADRTLTYQARLAESLYRRAIEAAAASADEEPGLAIRTSLGRAESLIELGRHQEATEPANAARDLARRSGDGHLEARALLALGRIESDVGDDEVARRLLGQALSSFEAVGDLGSQAWAKHRLSEVLGRADYALELEHLREAYRLFERAGDRWGLAVAAQDLAYLLTTVGGDEFHHWYGQARRLAGSDSDLRSRAALLRTWGYFSYYRGEHGEAIRAMGEARPIAVEAGDRYAEADTFLIEAMAASQVATPADAGRLAAEVVRLGRSIGSLRIAGLGLAVGARACLRQGYPARATRQLAAARQTLQRGGVRVELLEVDFVHAGVHLDRGSWQRVPERADRGAAGARASGWVLAEAMRPMLVGRALLGAGRLDQAIAELERALASAREAGATGTEALAAAALEQALLLAGRPPASRAPTPPGGEVEAEAIRAESGGLAALAAGAAEEAAAAFAGAADRWRQLGLTVWLGRALALQAAVARRTGDRAGADRLLAEAGKVLDRIGTPARSRPAVLAPPSPMRSSAP